MDSKDKPRSLIIIKYENTEYRYRIISEYTIGYLINILKNRFNIDKSIHLKLLCNNIVLDDTTFINEISHNNNTLNLEAQIKDHSNTDRSKYSCIIN